MCLILVAWQAHPDYPLVVAANRDEFHARPAAAAQFWDDRPAILAGRDLAARGTWLGVTRGGKFAAVTNVRDARNLGPGERSRGELARGFLENGDSARAWAAASAMQGHHYAGYNLLVADREELWWSSNRADGPQRLAPGIYGISNHLLDTAWPKVVEGKNRLRRALAAAPAPEMLLDLLADTAVAADAELPDTGVGLERERRLSALHIVSPEYGTRCATALLRTREGRLRFAERSFAPDGTPGDTLRYEFDLET